MGRNNLYRWALSQNLPVGCFEWVINKSKFNEDFIKNYIKDSDMGTFLQDDVKYFEKLHELHDNLLFLPERMKLKRLKNL